MRGIPKAPFLTGMLVLPLLMLAGCGRENLPQSEPESGIVVFQLDTQKPQMPQLAMAPQQSEPSGIASSTAPAATPQPAKNAPAKTTAPNADIDGLMDELETTLNELEASITAADRDTLTDSALVALEK